MEPVEEKIQIKKNHNPKIYLQKVHENVQKGHFSHGWVRLGLCAKKSVWLPYLKMEVHIPLLTDRGTPPIVSQISLFWNFSDPMSSGLLQVIEAGLNI